MPDSASILIADDEQSFRESTSRLLRREGFECHGVGDAEEAIESLQESRFDVLIADIRMPHNRDMRLVRMARQLDQDLAVIVATGYPSTETAIRSVEMSVVAYMTKPLDFNELMQHVRTALKSSLRRRTLTAIVERLRTCLANLETLKSKPLHFVEKNNSIPAETVRPLVACLSELLNMSAESAPDQASRPSRRPV